MKNFLTIEVNGTSELASYGHSDFHVQNGELWEIDVATYEKKKIYWGGFKTIKLILTAHLFPVRIVNDGTLRLIIQHGFGLMVSEGASTSEICGDISSSGGVDINF